MKRQTKMQRRALIGRRVAARKQSDAQRRIWSERKSRARTFEDLPVDDEHYESAGSPDIDLADIPEM